MTAESPSSSAPSDQFDVRAVAARTGCCTHALALSTEQATQRGQVRRDGHCMRAYLTRRERVSDYPRGLRGPLPLAHCRSVHVAAEEYSYDP
jgi:hypothetical protein